MSAPVDSQILVWLGHIELVEKDFAHLSVEMLPGMDEDGFQAGVGAHGLDHPRIEDPLGRDLRLDHVQAAQCRVEEGQIGGRVVEERRQQTRGTEELPRLGKAELGTACDLVYVAEDAKIGYPPVRLMSPPDMQWQTWLMGLRRGMEALLTGDAMSGTDAVAAGMANRAHPADELDDAVFVDPTALGLAALADKDVLGGLDLSGEFPELGNAMLVCATETKSDGDIEAYTSALGDIMREARVA